MKKQAVRSSLRKFLGGKRRRFISRERFLKDIQHFDEKVRAECVRRLGERRKVTFSVAQSILGDAVSRFCIKNAKTLKGLAPLRFKLTPGIF